MLNLEPYEYIDTKGKEILDFSHVIDIQDLFTTPPEGNIHLVLEKTDKYAEIPAIK